MTTPQTHPDTTAAAIADWAGSPLSTLHHVVAPPQPIPAEQYAQDGCYLIRFEVPGVDPVSDLQVSVTTGTLTVRAERRDGAPAGRQTEFRYGSFIRHIALPLGANVHDVAASYRFGVLTVRVGLQPEHEASARAIDVTVEP